MAISKIEVDEAPITDQETCHIDLKANLDHSTLSVHGKGLRVYDIQDL